MTEHPARTPAILAHAATHGDGTAIRTGEYECTYAELLARAESIAAHLLDGRGDLAEERVAFAVPAGADHVAVQWAIWRSGGVAVPLSLSATRHEWEYTLDDSGATTVLATRAWIERFQSREGRVARRAMAVEDLGVTAEPSSFPMIGDERRAMILYTSGTTSRPKGVVTTHGGLRAQIESLVEAWRWERADRIPLFLPLHHIHGIVNVMCCALWSGATIEPSPRFDTETVLRRVAEGAYTVFMAVPTIYVKLIGTIESLPPSETAPILDGFRRMRLMVSGSAALPASVHGRWAELTGQILLERYGMTEIGMALSNPYEGERRPGAVGRPLPGVEVRLVGEDGEVVDRESKPGEIQVRGRGVFREYWNRPEATRDSFRKGWFHTGDVAVLENGYYRILGRSSVDVIKSGGYKLSALEIESVLLDHPGVAECAVVGLPDDTWGEVVAVALVAGEGPSLDVESLRAWCSERLSSYKMPRRLTVVAELPRNAMGKITKPAVKKLFERADAT